MELPYLLFTAALAASLAGVCNAMLMPALARLRGKSAESWRRPTLSSQVALLAVYLVAGVSLGLLFWLSWGMAAIVGIPWWARGTLFALMIWCVSCMPLLLVQLIALKMHWSVALLLAIEWLITLSVVGVACSWAWSRGP